MLASGITSLAASAGWSRPLPAHHGTQHADHVSSVRTVCLRKAHQDVNAMGNVPAHSCLRAETKQGHWRVLGLQDIAKLVDGEGHAPVEYRLRVCDGLNLHSRYKCTTCQDIFPKHTLCPQLQAPVLLHSAAKEVAIVGGNSPTACKCGGLAQGLSGIVQFHKQQIVESPYRQQTGLEAAAQAEIKQHSPRQCTHLDNVNVVLPLLL